MAASVNYVERSSLTSIARGAPSSPTRHNGALNITAEVDGLRRDHDPHPVRREDHADAFNAETISASREQLVPRFTQKPGTGDWQAVWDGLLAHGRLTPLVGECLKNASLEAVSLVPTYFQSGWRLHRFVDFWTQMAAHVADSPEAVAKLMIHLGKHASPSPAWYRGREVIAALLANEHLPADLRKPLLELAARLGQA